MSNNNRKARKDNGKINKASYLISKFLSNEHSLKFKLCGNAQSLLIHLGWLMDAKLSKYKNIENRKCEVTITQLCRLAGMTDKPATKYIELLIKWQLIELIQKLPKNRSVYKLGKVFSVWENLRNCDEVSIGDLDFSFGDSPDSFGESPILYITTNSNYTNNHVDETLKTEKHVYKQAQPSPLLEEFLNTQLTKH